jgi:hypothetical protein
MKKRLLPAGAAMALGLGLLTASPATAAVPAVESITFPGGNSQFYSPFSGPATVSFAFAPADSDATFEIRLRPEGGTAIHERTVFIDPDTMSSPRDVSFTWPSLSVGSARTYQVAVFRNNVLQEQESFLLRPPLASITGATPNPFLPLIDDGHKDTTRVTFRLVSPADAEARVYRPNGNGNCCGTLVRDEMLLDRPAGSNSWSWDGRNNSNDEAGVGTYFVRIWADDGTLPPTISKAFKVSIVRTYRATATKSKAGTSYHHTTESALVRGGDCFVHAQGGYLQVDCHGAKMSVFYRWGLGSAQRIERASFVIDNANSECGSARRKSGHTKHESFLTVTDAVSGITSCRIVTARITYSFPKAS